MCLAQPCVHQAGWGVAPPQGRGVVRKYSSGTSVIARIPTGIAESSATKFVAWLIPEVVPGFCVPSVKKNAGAACAKYAKSSAAIAGGHGFTLAGPTARSTAGNMRLTSVGLPCRHILLRRRGSAPTSEPINSRLCPQLGSWSVKLSHSEVSCRRKAIHLRLALRQTSTRWGRKGAKRAPKCVLCTLVGFIEISASALI
jgi:hypothetical protein